MKDSARRFLLWSFAISSPVFFLALLLDRATAAPWREAAVYALLVPGFLGPLAGGLRTGGRAAMETAEAPLKSWLLAGWLLLLHVGALALLRMVAPCEVPGQTALSALPAALLLGAQEVGWSGVLQPGLAEGRKPWKATAATALLNALWFLPLMFLPGFPVRADHYLHFSAFLIGLRFVQTLLCQKTRSLPCCAAFTAGCYFLLTVFPIQQSRGYYLSMMIHLLLAFLYQSGLVRENNH